MHKVEHLSLQCIYCDDLRDELAGRSSVLGWYTTESAAMPESGPLILQSLCVIGTVLVPLDLTISSFKIELLRDDKVFTTMDVPSDAVAAMQSESAATFVGRELRIAIKVGNLVVDEPCTMWMRVVIDGNLLMGNGLRFQRKPAIATT